MRRLFQVELSQSFGGFWPNKHKKYSRDACGALFEVQIRVNNALGS